METKKQFFQCTYENNTMNIKFESTTKQLETALNHSSGKMTTYMSSKSLYYKLMDEKNMSFETARTLLPTVLDKSNVFLDEGMSLWIGSQKVFSDIGAIIWQEYMQKQAKQFICAKYNLAGL